MAKNDRQNEKSSDPNLNPFSHSGKGATGGTGGVNPSAPTAGTEAWGQGKDEASKTVNPRRTEMADTRQNTVTFSCSEINPSCNWKTAGQNEQEVRQQVEQHAREHHNMKEMGEDMWSRVKNALHRAA